MNGVTSQPATLGRYFFTSAYLMVNHDANSFTLWQANPSNKSSLVRVFDEETADTCSGVTGLVQPSATQTTTEQEESSAAETDVSNPFPSSPEASSAAPSRRASLAHVSSAWASSTTCVGGGDVDAARTRQLRCSPSPSRPRTTSSRSRRCPGLCLGRRRYRGRRILSTRWMAMWPALIEDGEGRGYGMALGQGVLQIGAADWM